MELYFHSPCVIMACTWVNHSRILLGKPRKIRKIRPGSLWDKNLLRMSKRKGTTVESLKNVVSQGNERTLSQVAWPVMHSDYFSNLTSQITRGIHFTSRKELCNTKYWTKSNTHVRFQCEGKLTHHLDHHGYHV